MYKISQKIIVLLFFIGLFSCDNNTNRDIAFKKLEEKLLYQKNDSLISNLRIKTSVKGQMLQFISGNKHPNVKMYAMIIFINDEEKKYIPEILKILVNLNYVSDKNVFFSSNNDIRIDFDEDLENANIFAKKLFEEVYRINREGKELEIEYETYDSNIKRSMIERIYPLPVSE